MFCNECIPFLLENLKWGPFPRAAWAAFKCLRKQPQQFQLFLLRHQKSSGEVKKEAPRCLIERSRRSRRQYPLAFADGIKCACAYSYPGVHYSWGNMWRINRWIVQRLILDSRREHSCCPGSLLQPWGYITDVRFFVKFIRGFLPPGLQDLLFHCVVLPPVLSVKLTGGCSAPTWSWPRTLLTFWQRPYSAGLA